MEKPVRKQANVMETLFRAVSESILLEIQIDAEEKRYGARLLAISETPESMKKQASEALLTQYASKIQGNTDASSTSERNDPWILITPLEPTDGNMKIRKANRVSLGFYLGLEQCRTVVKFRKVQRIETGQAIELSWPSAIITTAMRHQLRVDIPENINLAAQIQKRGYEPFVAKVVNLSQGGLSFACNELPIILEIGDKINLSILGDILLGTPINTYGSITNITVARDTQDVQVTKQLYGVQFKMLSVADAMSVDRLVAIVQPNNKSEGRFSKKRTNI